MSGPRHDQHAGSSSRSSRPGADPPTAAAVREPTKEEGEEEEEKAHLAGAGRGASKTSKLQILKVVNANYALMVSNNRLLVEMKLQSTPNRDRRNLPE